MNRIKELREKNGILQKELADMMGVNYVSVSKWENGKASPSEENLQKLAEYLGCEPEEILSGLENKKEPQNSVELTAAEKRLIDTIRELSEDKRGVACLTAELAVRGKMYRDLLTRLDEAAEMAEKLAGNK